MLTLDDDVKARLDEEMRKSGTSLKEAVNYYLRLGLNAPARMKPKPFVVRARKLGLPPGPSYDNVEELIEQLGGPLQKIMLTDRNVPNSTDPPPIG
ncbi:MAG TPA: CopG family transcriptional regulator [Bryobacteraceae bacterium]|nr:CopG family transcriptional regulator [Bryobacteraceae bacterium]